MDYTKGKWIASKGKAGFAIEVGEKQIASVPHYIGNTPQETEANAQLIAAAPKLLEACKEIILVWQGLDPDRTFPHLEETITRAIAKAEGKDGTTR